MSIILNLMSLRYSRKDYDKGSSIDAMIVIDGEVSVAEIDEALRNLKEMLVDRYGNRLTHQKKELLLSSVDDLLDERLRLMKEGKDGSDQQVNQRSNA
jgi:hypothetical protein